MKGDLITHFSLGDLSSLNRAVPVEKFAVMRHYSFQGARAAAGCFVSQEGLWLGQYTKSEKLGPLRRGLEILTPELK